MILFGITWNNQDVFRESFFWRSVNWITMIKLLFLCVKSVGFDGSQFLFLVSQKEFTTTSVALIVLCYYLIMISSCQWQKQELLVDVLWQCSIALKDYIIAWFCSWWLQCFGSMLGQFQRLLSPFVTWTLSHGKKLVQFKNSKGTL